MPIRGKDDADILDEREVAVALAVVARPRVIKKRPSIIFATFGLSEEQQSDASDGRLVVTKVSFERRVSIFFLLKGALDVIFCS